MKIVWVKSVIFNNNQIRVMKIHFYVLNARKLASIMNLYVFDKKTKTKYIYFTVLLARAMKISVNITYNKTEFF